MSAFWVRTDKFLCELPIEGVGNTSCTISATDVPSEASEILLYAWIDCGAGKAEVEGHFEIKVRQEQASSPISFYLRYHAYSPQNAWAFNSANFWLPMPPDRTVFIERDGEELEGSIKSGVKLIGYR